MSTNNICFYGEIWKISQNCLCLFVLGFNDTSSLVGHFVSSPREREKRDRRDSRGDEREGQERKVNKWKWRNRRNKNILPLPLPAARIAVLAQLLANISWTPQWYKIHDTFASPNQPLHSPPTIVTKYIYSIWIQLLLYMLRCLKTAGWVVNIASQIRYDVLWCLIWVYTICSGLSVTVLRLHMV